MKDIPTALSKHNVPRHVAIIMDGNGRWAKQQHRPRLWGHSRGVDTVREVVRAASDVGVEVLTLFAFSEENWARPRAEVDGIMGLIDRYIQREKAELNRNNVRLRTIGDLERLPTKTQALLQQAVDDLDGNTGLLLQIALSYGARSELAAACRKVARLVQEGRLDPDDIDQDVVEANLLTAGLPDPDLLIRTSGEERLSNFMLWQVAYSEFHFTDTYWPAFSRQEFFEILLAYQQRQRRFGLTGEQITDKTLSSPKLGPIARVVAMVRGESPC